MFRSNWTIISNACTRSKFGFAVFRNVYLPQREVNNCFIPSTMRCVFPFMLASLKRRASINSAGCLDSIRVRIALLWWFLYQYHVFMSMNERLWIPPSLLATAFAFKRYMLLFQRVGTAILICKEKKNKLRQN